jgi:serine/threonine protein phosphatase 1
MSVAVEVSPWTPAPFALDGETLFAVGDVHGLVDHLQSLLDAVRTLAAGRYRLLKARS